MIILAGVILTEIKITKELNSKAVEALTKLFTEVNISRITGEKQFNQNLKIMDDTKFLLLQINSTVQNNIQMLASELKQLNIKSETELIIQQTKEIHQTLLEVIDLENELKK